MKRCSALVLTAIIGLLASCAPTVTGPIAGRIVNGTTGEEGAVSFTRGTLQPRIGDPFAADNAVISIGGTTYRGRSVVLDGGTVSTLPANWGLSLGFSGGTRHGEEAFGWGTRLDSPRRDTVSLTRTGNLIARSAAPNAKTLTCTLLVDAYEHGVGDCTGNNGVKYALQF